MMRILLAPDKFKGCMSAEEVCAVLEPVLRKRGEVVVRPISDGGEGFTATMQAALGGVWKSVKVRGPLGVAVEAGYARCGATAVLEMAHASGLNLVPPASRDPWRASTFGTGELILAAANHGAEEILVGIGGSATNDGGVGMALALGFQFLDAGGREIMELPHRLMDVRRILPPPQNLPPVRVACDVENPLLGMDGCTRIYGPQKGITAEDFSRHEGRLGHLASLLGVLPEAGSGAAGGLGYGLVAFARAQLESGFSLVARTLGLEALVKDCDLVITGEGSLDASSLAGKAPAALARLARAHRKPIVALCGRVEESALPQLRRWFSQILPITPPSLSFEEAVARAPSLLAAAAERIQIPKSADG